MAYIFRFNIPLARGFPNIPNLSKVTVVQKISAMNNKL